MITAMKATEKAATKKLCGTKVTGVGIFLLASFSEAVDRRLYLQYCTSENMKANDRTVKTKKSNRPSSAVVYDIMVI